MEQLNLGRIISEQTIRELLIKELPQDLADHPLSTDAHEATSAAMPDRIVIRDESGRAKVAAPSAEDDIARKHEVDIAAKTAEWAGVAGRPNTFPVDTHNHEASEITSGILSPSRGGTGNANGNAATATKLATARTIAITGGATGTATSFDGSGNISIPVTGLNMGSANAGTLAVARGGTGNTTGNAATATKLSTARTIAISGGATGTATSFDGSGNISIPVTGLNMGNATAGTLAVARGGTGQTTAQAFRNAMGLGNTTGALPIANGGTGNTTGLAVTATKLATARKISLSGDVTGSATFDGSANITLAATVALQAGKYDFLKEIPGYYVTPGGLILNWGECSTKNSGKLTFAKAFPTAFLFAVLSPGVGTSLYKWWWTAGNKTTLSVRYGHVGGDDDTTTKPPYYLAFGY